MSVDNLTLNKKGTKVKVIGKEKYYNILGTIIQWGPSFTYLAIKFDLFKFENDPMSITLWGFVAITMVFLLFKQKIKDKMKEYENQFGATWSRAKAGHISLTIASVLFLVYILSYSFFLIFFIFAGSTYLSLFFYAPYDEMMEKRKIMQKMLDEKEQTKDFEKLTQRYEELKSS